MTGFTGLFIGFLRDLRLVPIVLMATIALFALKALGLVLDGGYLFDNLKNGRDGRTEVEITGTVGAPRPAPASPAAAKQSWAQPMFNSPDVTGSVEPAPGFLKPDITGAAGAAPSSPAAGAGPSKGEAPAAKKPQEPPSGPNGVPVPLDVDHPASPSERAILESLQKRRAELDARAHELDVREDLLRAAEKRVAGRIDELKDLEARVDAAIQKRDEAEVARFKGVVTMYENMKAKDAAKIFDGLDIKVLLDVAKEMNPRRMSDILALMTPENAQRLTVELSMRPDQREESQAADLPKIQGKSSPN